MKTLVAVLFMFVPALAYASGGLVNFTGPLRADGPLGGVLLAPNFAGWEAFNLLMLLVAIAALVSFALLIAILKIQR